MPAIIDCSRNEFLYPHPLLSARWWPRLDADRLCRYRQEPDLPALIAERYQVQRESIRLHNGAEHALKAVFAATARMPGATLLMPVPAWHHYDVLARRYGLGIEPYPYARTGDTFTLDVPALRATIHRTALPVLLLASPANPLGCRLPEAVLGELTELVAARGYSIVDQTYAGYAGQPGMDWSVGGLLQLLPRTLLIRSLSKYYGLAGLRVGFTAAATEVHDAFQIVPDYLGYNAFSDAFATECLRRHREFEVIAAKLIDQRDALRAFYAATPGFDAFRSDANFLLVRPSADGYARLLGEVGILVREFSEASLGNCVRITIPPPAVVKTIMAVTRSFPADR